MGNLSALKIHVNQLGKWKTQNNRFQEMTGLRSRLVARVEPDPNSK